MHLTSAPPPAVRLSCLPAGAAFVYSLIESVKEAPPFQVKLLPLVKFPSGGNSGLPLSAPSADAGAAFRRIHAGPGDSGKAASDFGANNEFPTFPL